MKRSKKCKASLSMCTSPAPFISPLFQRGLRRWTKERKQGRFQIPCTLVYLLLCYSYLGFKLYLSAFLISRFSNPRKAEQKLCERLMNWNFLKFLLTFHLFIGFSLLPDLYAIVWKGKNGRL